MTLHENCSLIELLASLSEEERTEALAGFTDPQIDALMFDWRATARANQIQPEGDWLHWLVMAGRGYGKTRTGAETVREWAEEKLPAPIHLIAPTAADIRKVMIEGPSGLLACYPPGQAPHYEPSKGHLITWQNGNIAYCFSADEPERLRGPQCCRYWADELCAWRFLREAWDNLMFGFRIGELRGLITTTPKPLPLIRELMATPHVHVTRGSTYENAQNLAPAFFEHVVRRYEGTRIGRQELNAEILEDVIGALWKRQMLEASRIRAHEIQWDKIIRTVIAIDPAVTSTAESDETGMIVGALTKSGHVLILDDLSCRESALTWASIAVTALHSKRADRIVGERNNGGDLIETTLRAVSPNIPYRSVWASKGKEARAEPVAALYEQGRVHHVGNLPNLEDEMCRFVPGADNKPSPNRMDAMVWCVTELLGLDARDPQSFIVPNPQYQISPI